MPKGSSSDPLSEIVGAATIGRAVGVTGRRITQLRDEGRIPGVAGGKFVLGAAVSAYCGLFRRVTGKEAAGGAEGATNFDRARIRLLTMQADGQELRNAVTRGELLNLDAVELVLRTL